MRASYNPEPRRSYLIVIVADMKMRASYNSRAADRPRPAIVADMKMRASYNEGYLGTPYIFIVGFSALIGGPRPTLHELLSLCSPSATLRACPELAEGTI